MHACRGTIALAVAVTVWTGCVPVPFIVPVPPLGFTEEGKPINEDLIAFIRPGVTTKADVVWELGAPDESRAADPDESRVALEDWFSYTSWRHRGGVFGGVVLIGPYFFSPGPVAGAYICRRPWALKIWFDEAGVVERREFTKGETQCKTEDLK